MPTLTSYVDKSFQPTSVAGLSIWLDAADASTLFQDVAGTIPSTNGSKVQLWKDKSVNAYNATQATSSIAPTLSTNEIVFNVASSTSLTTTYTAAPANETLFVVINPTTINSGNTAYEIICSSAINGREFYFYQGLLNTATSGINSSCTTPTVALNQKILLEMSYAGTSASIVHYYNGTLQIDSNSTTPPSFSGTGTTRIGAGPTTSYFAGTISEIICYNTVLSLGQRQQVEGYLAWKWNLVSSLPANHPYKNEPSYGTNYGSIVKSFIDSSLQPNNIAGLALWLDAADASTFSFSSGSNISQWRDKSSSGINMAYDTGTVVYNTTGFNNSPTIAFGPGKSGLTYNSPVNLSATASLSFYIVLKSTTSSGNTRILSFYASGNDYTPPGFDIAIIGTRITPTRGNPYAMTSPINVSNTNIFTSIIFNGNTTGTYAIPSSTTGVSVNGGTFTNFTGTYSIGTSFSTYNPFKIGEWSGTATDIFVGNISEIIMYNRALNATENSQIEGYLAWKWNLAASLPSNHPYKNAPYTTNYGSIMKNTPF